MESERKRLNKQVYYWVAIMDAFTGQMTNKVLAVLADNQIRYEKFRTSLTNQFHLLGLTVNEAAEHFPEKTFAVWYAKQVISAI